MNNLDITELMANPILEPIRKGFGRGLESAGRINPHVVALCADLTESTQMHLFREANPDRFFEVGIAEQNLVTVGSGLASQGFIPYVSSYAAFSPGRNWEQIRTTICLNNQPVKIIGSHAGLYTGPDGATHQVLEDIALMRVLPNMVVIAPGDSIEAEQFTLLMADDHRPNYLRLAREATPIYNKASTNFSIGPAYKLFNGHEITIISTGTMTQQAIKACIELIKHDHSVELIHVPTIKPLDKATILKSLGKTRLALTIEEAQINGGLGGAVCEVASHELPTRIFRMGVYDRFGESGKPDELLTHFHLTDTDIVHNVKALLKIYKGKK